MVWARSMSEKDVSHEQIGLHAPVQMRAAQQALRADRPRDHGQKGLQQVPVLAVRLVLHPRDAGGDAEHTAQAGEGARSRSKDIISTLRPPAADLWRARGAARGMKRQHSPA